MTDVEGDIALKFDVASVRSDFPILGTTVRGVPLCYLDNGATTQKPLCVIETIDSYYKSSNSNIHRGVHYLSQVATELYENARATVRRFINAASDKEIIFTRGTTESINLVASSFGNRFISQGDEILITEMEHHSNIVPWQLLCERNGAILKVANVHPDGTVDIEDFKRLLSTKTKIVSVVHVSNSLGTINPIKDIIEAAHQVGAKVLIDGAQAVAHIEVDVQGLDCDFYVFSGHKLYAPTGIGVLYGKEEILNAMPPYQGGGDMILSVSFDKTIYNELPAKFEAGTPHIAGAIGLATAIDYLVGIGIANAAQHEHMLLDYATNAMRGIPQVQLVGTAPNKSAVLSFTLKGIHPHDVGSLLDRDGIAIRAGHLCTQPILRKFGVHAVNRASFAMYNTIEEVDRLIASVQNVIRIFA